MKKKTIKAVVGEQVLLALYRGKEIRMWFGGDGSFIPVWQDTPDGKKASKMFKDHESFHKPEIVSATITYQLKNK